MNGRKQTFLPGELPLVILALCEERDLKPYELIDQLAEVVPGYQPSPGGIYPALRALSREGLLARSREGRAHRYGITDEGRAALDRRRDQLEEIQSRIRADLRSMPDLGPVIEGFRQRVSHVPGLTVEVLAEVLEQAWVQIRDQSDHSDQSDRRRMR